MPTPKEQAARELAAKLSFEADLAPRISALQNETVEEVTRALARTGHLPDIANLEAANFEPVLREHYDEVASFFDHVVSDQLPSDVSETPEERVAIVAALVVFFDQRAKEQAKHIAETSAKQARVAVRIANEESRQQFKKDGTILTVSEEAIAAGAIFKRAVRGRATGIRAFETQAAAEASKLQNVITLLDVTSTINSGLRRGGRRSSPPSPELPPDVEVPSQTWVTMGDDLVRKTPGSGHVGADSQQVPIGQPFTVGGQKLMHPGDTSLGATLNNTSGCRCSAIPDIDGIADARRAAEVGGEFVPQVVSAQVPPRRVPGARGLAEPGPNFDAPESIKKWTDGKGNLLPERARLHEDILDGFVRGAEVKQVKTLQMVGGGPASGKGTLLKSGQLELPKNAVTVDADELKGKLPEFIAGSKVKDPNAAAFVHEESSQLGKKLQARAREGGFDTILDGTGDGTIEKLTANVKKFKDQGYRVVADYVTVPTEVAVKRAFARGQRSGRFVPNSVTREIHAGVSRAFPQAVRNDIFDEARLFDTDVAIGADPILVLSKIDGKQVIHDQERWEAFLAKANEGG